MVNRELATSQAVVVAVQAMHDQNRTLVHAEVQISQDFEEMLAEVRHCLDGQSSLLRSSHEMFSMKSIWL